MKDSNTIIREFVARRTAASVTELHIGPLRKYTVVLWKVTSVERSAASLYIGLPGRIEVVGCDSEQYAQLAYDKLSAAMRDWMLQDSLALSARDMPSAASALLADEEEE